jgi:hypothetical protein
MFRFLEAPTITTPHGEALAIMATDEYASDPAGVTLAVIELAVVDNLHGDHDGARHWAGVANLLIGEAPTREELEARRGPILNALNEFYTRPAP